MLFKRMGEVYAHELEQPERAIDAYLNALDLEDNDVDALDALSELYAKKGDYSEAIQIMSKLSSLLDEPEKQVALRYRTGQVTLEHIGDLNEALTHFESALDIDAHHLPSLRAMRKIYIDMSDWHSAIRMLEREIAAQDNPRQISKAYVELGRLYDEKLEEHERAVEAYGKALEHDNYNEDAGLPLAKEFRKQGDYSKAMPLLQMLINTVDKRPKEEQFELWGLLGETAARVSDNTLAVEAYEHAHALDPKELSSLLGLAEAYYRNQAWDKAFKSYQMALVHHRDALEKEASTDIFFRLGNIKREQGETRKALNMFDKALDEIPTHRPSLEAIISLHEEQKDWERVVHFKKRMLDAVDGQGQIQLLDEIGSIWSDQLKNPQKAIESFNRAIELNPDDHRILHKMLALYQKTKQWPKAVELIDRISDLDERPLAKAKYAYTSGVIYRDELKNPALALDKFSECLDADPDQLKAFEAINKLLTQKKDWKGLERAFRKMLHRIVGKGNIELEFNLWHNLGVIYRDRMQNHENASEAFKMASALKPEDITEHQILAELYRIMPGKSAEAIKEHQSLLDCDAFRVDSYKELYKLYFEERDYDKAWCLSSALVFLQKAQEEHKQFYAQYKPKGLVKPKRRLDNDNWARVVRHPNEDPLLSAMFRSILPALLGIKAVSDKNLGLNKKHLHDPATSTVTFAKTFHFVTQILNVEIVPRLFLRPDAPGGVLHAVTQPPAMVAGSSVLQGFNPQDLTFVVAKHLSYYRPEYYIRKVLPSRDELKAALLASVRICGLGVQDPNIDQWASEISANMQPVYLEQLRRVCKQFVEAGAVTNVKRWIRAVELTVCRVGFLVNGELETAARMIQAEPQAGPDDLPAKDKISEIVRYSVSEDYFEARKLLGVQIDIG
ncbi:MAG: tetratricopeptide repeat protein [Myxococcales bacterium]|nr:MAG: tetratricopeptide repeat protein [Myxococcales bacterium]